MFLFSFPSLIFILYILNSNKKLLPWLSTAVIWLSSLILFYIVSILNNLGIQLFANTVKILNNWSIVNQLVSLIYILTLIYNIKIQNNLEDIISAIDDLNSKLAKESENYLNGDADEI
jgi:hypothetical protein